MTMTEPETTDFGFQTVPAAEKAGRVRRVFDSVAGRYDVMNDLMSLGVHRLWKRAAVELLQVRAGQRILDLATGTGDMAVPLAHQAGPAGWVMAADINAAMLARGRAQCADRGAVGNIAFVQADAERLPFPDDYFDGVMMAFGLRNVTHKDAALRAIHRVLRPGGRVLILEFSRAKGAVRPLYDAYSLHALPLIGRLVAGDADSYRYLAESIRRHPDQAALKALMEQAGFERCDYIDMSAGIVALHRGYKF